MSKILTGTLIGGLILFAWQTLSWTALGVHDEAFKYAPSQDSIISYLEQNLPEAGQYRIPNQLPGTTPEEGEAYMKKLEGKPWAIVTYHSYYKYDMFSPIVRGLLISLICVFLVCLVINQLAKRSFLNVFFTAFAFGLVSFLFVSYGNHNWFQTPWHYLTGELTDTLAGWSLVGIWLGLWHKRK